MSETGATADLATSRRPPVLLTRFGLSAVSQLLSSVTNLGLITALAVFTTPEDFGRIVAVYSMYMLALTLSRALTTDVLVAGGDGRPDVAAWQWAKRRILRAGAVGAGGALVVGVVVGADVVPLVILAGSIPGLLLQDGIRHLAWVEDRPDEAVMIDGVWLAVSAVIVGLALALSASLSPSLSLNLSVQGGLGPRAVVIGWCVGGLVSCWFAWRRVAIPVARPNDEESRFIPNLGQFRALAVSQAMMAAAVNVGPVMVAIVLSSTMAGALKAVILPVAPVLSLFAGIRVITLPALRAAAARGQAGAFALRLFCGAVFVAAVGSAVSVWVVQSLPVAWIGESVALVRPHLPWSIVICALFVGGQQLADSAAIAGRGAGTERLFVAVTTQRLASIGLEWTCLMGGAWLFGIQGLVIGWAVGVSSAAVVWIRL